MSGWPDPQPTPSQEQWQEGYANGLRYATTGELVLVCGGDGGGRYGEGWSAGLAAGGGMKAARAAREAEAEHA